MENHFCVITRSSKQFLYNIQENLLRNINDFYARMKTDVSFVCSTTLIYKSKVFSYKKWWEVYNGKINKFYPYAYWGKLKTWSLLPPSLYGVWVYVLQGKIITRYTLFLLQLYELILLFHFQYYTQQNGSNYLVDNNFVFCNNNQGGRFQCY